MTSTRIKKSRRTTSTKISPYFRGKRSKTKMKVIPGPKWNPPKSPFNLIQEQLYHDPWKLLVATIFLNRTRGDVAIPLLMAFLTRWPHPCIILNCAKEEEIAELLQPLGLHRKRAHIIKKFSGVVLCPRLHL